ncbi:putative aldouronate transport system substrate-binding protein [Catenuloplanes nepalensis]|uniref:Aldouronate transport system substrate-binding protein n=1 Tax=Catenuloplanes nepalensis TaxID=587533 RepID=A0ABT9MNP0_9ACTN|nr:ABC transporter substrate-binding protein [Catenuloplanes nepalensis]MDP9793017.1 putative aldouronate transport system substrate-binding protein [Catenuloplanes nepalensis]
MSITSTRLSRRGLLAAGGGLSIAAMLAAAGCGDSSGSSGADRVTVLLPGNTPTGWPEVLAQVNTKLQAELGLTLDAQFIAWTNYANQSLLKFTAGEPFDTALQARWLNMIQLAGGRSLAAVNPLLDSGKYPNLSKTLDPKLIENNKWSGTLYGVPQVNSAARIQHFVVRQDLADKVGAGVISDYAALEKFWYDVKQKVDGVTPLGLNSNMTNLIVVPNPIGLLNPYSWENPYTVAQYFSGNSMFFVMAPDAAATGSSRPIPFWDAPGVVDALRTVRRYYQDGIINKDALNVDADTQKSLFGNGRQASAWAMTDGTSSSYYLPLLRKSTPGAALANVVPLRGGKSVKPNQTFQAENFVVLNAKGRSNDNAMRLQDWLSIRENHDLISYGIEGRDWKATGEKSLEQLSEYSFPGFALSWRAPLERTPSVITETEADWFAWAQNYDNFTTDPFAGFIPDVTPVKREDAQMAAAFTQFANPLFFGAVDVDSGLDKLKKAVDAAGLERVRAELEKQADAYLKSR